MNQENEIYEEAMTRKPTQKQLILKVLRQAGDNGVLNTDLVEICIGYRSRIAEMYQAGFKIDVENLKRGVCKYTLRSEPEIEKTNIKSAFEIIASHVKTNGSVTSDELVELLNKFNFNIVRRGGSHKTETVTA